MFAAASMPWWWAGVGDWASLGLVVLGLLAVIPIVQTRRARDIEILMEIGRRWDSPEMAEARALVDTLAARGELAKVVCEGFTAGGQKYHELMQEPGYLEDLGVIFYSRGIRKKTLAASMGFLVPERWEKWEGALDDLGAARRKPEHFSYFREMAHEMKHGGSHGEHRRRAVQGVRGQLAGSSPVVGPLGD